MAKILAKNNDLLAEILENLYLKYNYKKFIPPDPLQFIYKYSEPADMEIAGFLAGAFAYGSALQIQKFMALMLGVMGKSPAAFIAEFSAQDKKHFAEMKYRFNTSDDIIGLLTILKKVLNTYGSLENLFLAGYDKNDETIIPALTNFCGSLTKYSPINSSRYLQYLFPNPANKSTCKRMFLFLRWMVRDGRIDSGLWKKVDKAKLVIPLDIHMTRLCKTLGLHDKKNPSLKTAIEVTNAFKKFSSNDPTKYDFSLCRIGILENCNGKKNDYCPKCELKTLCKLC